MIRPGAGREALPRRAASLSAEPGELASLPATSELRRVSTALNETDHLPADGGTAWRGAPAAYVGARPRARRGGRGKLDGPTATMKPTWRRNDGCGIPPVTRPPLSGAPPAVRRAPGAGAAGPGRGAVKSSPAPVSITGAGEAGRVRGGVRAVRPIGRAGTARRWSRRRAGPVRSRCRSRPRSGRAGRVRCRWRPPRAHRGGR